MSSTQWSCRRRGRRASALAGVVTGAVLLGLSGAAGVAAAPSNSGAAVVKAVLSATPMSGRIGSKVVFHFKPLAHTNRRELSSGGIRFGSAVATRWGVTSSTSAWAIVPKGASSAKITLFVPANTIAEDGPLHPAEVVTTSALFAVAG